MIVVPLTLLVICMILYTMFKIVQMGAADSGQRRHGAASAACWRCCSPARTSASLRGVGFLALFGVSVQTGVIMLEYINQLRARGHTILDAAIEGAVLRLRPIMMTMLVASFGLLPAALSRGIGSDSQRPFAIVIVGGLVAALILGVFLLPTLVRLGCRRTRRVFPKWKRNGIVLRPPACRQSPAFYPCPLMAGILYPSYSTIVMNPKSICNCWWQ